MSHHDLHGTRQAVIKYTYTFKVDSTSLILEIRVRLHAHLGGTKTRPGTEVMFTLLSLAHAFGTRLLCT